MEILFWLAIVLAIVTLVGHGIWVAIATLAKALNGEPPTGHHCPVCRTPLKPDPHFCNVCNWSSTCQPDEQSLRISLQMLERAADRGLIDEAALQNVRRALIEVARPLGPSPPDRVRPGPAGRSATATNVPEPIRAEFAAATDVPQALTPHKTPGTESQPTAADAPSAAPPVFNVAERARRFAERQATRLAGAADQPIREKKRVERRPWSELLAAFMHEKNIRWGELVGGLLIVSSSIALVVSFWEHIAARPLLKFGVFTGVTAALFGLGLHASHRWKLPTTSQGMLMIALMLVPLNFLAMASFAEASELTYASIAGEFVTLGIFLVLGYYASRILTPKFPWLTDLLVVGLAFSNLLIRRFIFSDPAWEALYAVALPLVAVYQASLWPLAGTNLDEGADDSEAIEVFTNQVWKLLGLVSFAFAVAVGLLIVRTERLGGALQRLSPLLMLAAAPPTLIGARFWQTAKARDVRSLLVPSCAVGLAGLGVMLSGIILSWPIPWLMIASCLLGAVMCLVLAIWMWQEVLHLGVAALLSIAFALAGLVLGGNLSMDEPDGRAVLSQWLSVDTGFWYTGFSLLLLGVAIPLRSASRSAVARSYTLAAVVSGLVGAALITMYGFGRHEHAISVSVAYATYAVLFYLAGHYLNQSRWQWLSGAAIAGACFQGTYFGWMHDAPVLYRLIISLLQISTIDTATAIGEQVSKPRTLKTSQIGSQWPFEIMALAGCTLTTVVACGALVLVSPRPAPWAWAGIAALWFTAAWRYTNRPMFAIAQAAVLVMMVLALDDYARTSDWYATIPFGWSHPLSLELQAAGLAMFGAVWLGIRWLTSVWTNDGIADAGEAIDRSERTSRGAIMVRAHGLVRSTAYAVDAWATAAAVTILWALAVYAAAPGVLQELLPADAAPTFVQDLSSQTTTDAISIDPIAENSRRVVDPVGFELFEIPHHLIGTPATWWLLVLVVIVTLAAVLERGSIERLTLLVTAVAAAVYLSAMRWEADVCVASALRWNLAAFFLIGNAALWIRRYPDAGEIRRHLFGIICAHTFLPLVAMAVCVAVVALQLQPPRSSDVQRMLWLFLVGVLGLGIWAGERRATLANWLTEDGAARRRAITVSTAVLACLPVLAITLYLVGTSLALHPVTGPDPGSVFARMGLAASYSVPILLVSIGLTGTAIALRSASIALWAGIVLNVGGTAAYMLNLGAAGFEVEHWLQLAEVNATISALFALGWIGVASWRSAAADEQTDGLRTQINVACGFFSVAMVGVLSVLWWDPRLPVPLEEAAVPWGWLSAVSVVAVCYFATRFIHGIPLESNLLGLAIAISALVGCHLQDRLTGVWNANYTVMAMVALSSALVVWRMIDLRFGLIHAWNEPTNRPEDADERLALTAQLRWWVVVAIWILTAFAARFLEDATTRTWPTVGFLMAAAGLAGVTGWIQIRGRALWWSAILVNLSVTILWLFESRGWQIGLTKTPVNVLYVNALAATLPTLGWVLVFRHWQSRPDATAPPARASAVHRFAVPIALLLILAMATFWLLFALRGRSGIPNPHLVLATILVVGFACWSCFWDDEIRWQALGLYATGLCGAVAILQALGLAGEPLTWSAPLVLGAYGLAASYLISRRAEMSDAMLRFHLLPRSSKTAGIQAFSAQGTNLIVASCVLAGVTVAIAFLAQFRCADQAFRVAASQSILAQALALALLTRYGAPPEDTESNTEFTGVYSAELRFGALGLGVVAAIANGWSNFDPSLGLPYERTTVVAMACSVMAVIYGLGLVKIVPSKSPWIDTARQLMPALIALSAGIVCGVMVLEMVRYVRFEIQPPWFAIAGVTVTLGIALLASMVAAVVPGRDPLGLSEEKRVVYVYAAEVFLLLIVIHIRISLPWLFRGWVQQVWPLMIMLIAFAGIGMSEWARRYASSQSTIGTDRSRYNVLVGPLENTSAILPLLPALGYWMLPSEVHYSWVMVVVGLGYGVLAQLRKSFGFSILAALAANGSLWFLLHDSAIGLLSHPQVWLIPPAICVLVAAQLNRQRLSAEQLTTIRYACSIVIYVSSTAEIFIAGVADAPWLPLVLAGLSLVGITVGIAAHIRAFLWLGLSFLVVSMMTIIWYAAVDLQQTWLWYVTGIVMGVIILAVFAFFEKRRADVLRWADRLKQWEA